MQSIASKLREPEHSTPAIVEEVKEKIKGQNAIDDPQQQKSSVGHNEQQERLTEKIISEGMKKLGRRPEEKQVSAKAGTPTEVRRPHLERRAC